MALTLVNCVTLRRLSNFPGAQFYLLFDRSNNTCLMGVYDHYIKKKKNPALCNITLATLLRLLFQIYAFSQMGLSCRGGSLENPAHPWYPQP